MKTSSAILLCLLLSTLLIGCGRKDADQAEVRTDVLLQPGTGALLVMFPNDPTIHRSKWRTQVTMEGPQATRSLPRVPMADLQTVTVLHVLPGTYKINASAWRHGMSPASGGSNESVEIRAGQITVLKARNLGGDPYPHVHTSLDFVRFATWTLNRAERFQDYVAETVKESVKG